MMKHIIVAGASRAGKTTLCKKIKKEGYTYYKMDSIKRGIYNNFVEHDCHDWKNISPKMVKLIDSIISDTNTDTTFNDEWYVFDVPYLYPHDIKEFKSDNILIIYLGYSEISLEDEISAIRKYDMPNYWTYNLSYQELREISKRNIHFSKYLKKECEKLNIKYYDTSFNREDKIDKIFDDIFKC